MKVIHLNILEESFCLFHEHVFCTFKFHCIFEILPDRKILYTYLSSAIEFHGTKKKLNFVDQCGILLLKMLYITPCS